MGLSFLFTTTNDNLCDGFEWREIGSSALTVPFLLNLPQVIYSFQFDYFHYFVAVVVDDFDGDFARIRFWEWT